MEALTIASLAIWLATIASQPLVALRIWRSNSRDRWLPLLLLMCFNSCKSFVLFSLYLAGRPGPYFYIFWGGLLLDAAIEVWLLWRVVSSHWPRAHRPKWLSPAYAAIFSVSSAVSIYPAASFPLPYSALLARVATSLDRVLALSWCLSFVVIAGFAELIGLRLRLDRLAISAGFAFQWLGEAIWSWLIALHPTGIYLLKPSDVSDLCYLASLFCWSVALFTKNERPPSHNLKLALQETLLQLNTEAGINSKIGTTTDA